MEQRPKVVRDMCGVAQHAENTPGQGKQGQNPIYTATSGIPGWFLVINRRTWLPSGLLQSFSGHLALLSRLNDLAWSDV